MIARQLHRRRWAAPLAAVLLVLQGLAGGVVPLAHASERFTAPAHIEAQHGSGCLVLHDALRCTLCQYAGTRVVAEQTSLETAARGHVQPRLTQLSVAPTAGSEHLTAPPRAPPALFV